MHLNEIVFDIGEKKEAKSQIDGLKETDRQLKMNFENGYVVKHQDTSSKKKNILKNF